MMSYEKGDVILVPFPFSDQSSIKKRPAVIISSQKYNTISSDVMIMAVTSQIGKTRSIGECLIENWRDAGLLKASSIKPALSTIDQSLILKRLGKLVPDDQAVVEKALKEILEIK